MKFTWACSMAWLAFAVWARAQTVSPHFAAGSRESEFESKLRAWRDEARFSSAQSRSGQFVVVAEKLLSVPPRLPVEAHDPQLRRLVPDLLAASCEHIKHLVQRELNIQAHKGGKIYVTIRPAMLKDNPIPVTSAFYADGWKHHVELPAVVREDKVVRAIVHALLSDLAHAHAGGKSAEIPFWLTEGLTQWLLAANEADLILQPQSSPPQKLSVGQGQNAINVWRQTGTLSQGLKRDPFFEARRRLSHQAPLIFAELTLSTPDRLDSPVGEIYQSCAQLLVRQLLTLQNGRNNLRTMVSLLPQFLNWQMAFLRAFNQDFASLLAVEKWWALTLANFTKRDHWQAWPREASLEKLIAALRLPAQIRVSTNDLPARTELALQSAIQEMDFSRQKPLLQRAVNQLLAVRTRMAPELVPLVDAYRQVLENYLEARNQAGFAADRRGHLSNSRKMVVQETIRKLNALDQQCWERQRSQARAENGSP